MELARAATLLTTGADMDFDGFLSTLDADTVGPLRVAGRSAPLSAPESARGIVEAIDALTLKRSGPFVSHDGSDMAW